MKATHVFVNSAMQVTLIDFGLAEEVDFETGTSDKPGGTFHTMSPEMLELYIRLQDQDGQ